METFSESRQPALPLPNHFLPMEKIKKTARRKRKYPSVRVKDTAENFQIEMVAPGIKKENLKVEIIDDLLTIFSDTGRNEQYNTYNATTETRKRNSSSFSHSFGLIHSITRHKVAAKYIHGILYVIITKKESDERSS